MSSARRRRHFRNRAQNPEASRKGSKAGMLVLVLCCIAAAGAAFWITRQLLGPGRTIVVSTNTVILSNTPAVVPDPMTL
ncbi:MAG TPA: hypothetical protein VJS65_04245, partial [Verrucomicrobiae bacterium]|nr:hypothetical protein [Verrucomicrobiae bacterium]